MLNVLGCSLSEDLLSRFMTYLVCDPAPFFIADDIPLPDETLILNRKTFAESGFHLSYRDSYTTYAVDRQAEKVALLSSLEFDALPMKTQQLLLLAQCELGRGQVYLWDSVAPFLHTCVEQAKSRCVTLSGEKFIVLDAKIWHLLNEEVRKQWLIQYITADNPLECLSATLSETELSRIKPTSVRDLAGTFADRSGANCFSTTLAATTQASSIATTIANFWVHQDPFFDGLARRRYTLVSDDGFSRDTLRDAVLVWQDKDGIAQHACYVIGDGLVLNKNSQAWYAPRQLLNLDRVLDYWADDPFKVVVYQRT